MARANAPITDPMLRICSCFVFALLACQASAAEIRGSVRVIDGDGIYVGPINVRLFGIDAPERDQTCQSEDGVDWACGAHVRQLLIDRYGGQQAQCQTYGFDGRGRTLAVCVVNGENINRWLVSGGWAFAYRKYSMMFDLDEKGAAVNDRGLHGGSFQAPALFRQAKRGARNGVVAPDPACAIKGNISPNSGERIFHRPGQRDYARTGINERRGERWFCSESEAVAAGWRPALR